MPTFYRFKAFCLIFVISVTTFGQALKLDRIESRNALELWGELMRQATSWNTKAVVVAGTNSVVTYGGEKEASSSKLTRLMGLNAESFKKSVYRLSPKKRTEFLRNFLHHWVYGTYAMETNEDGSVQDLSQGVADAQGKIHKVSLSELDNIDFDELGLAELEEKFRLWLSRTHDKPFSFLNHSVRRKIFLGTLAGIEDGFIGVNSQGKPHYKGWTPLFGDPEKYIASVTPQVTNNGWEVQFKPLNSFGEFENMKDWFRAIMGDTLEDGSVKLFQAPGHQWLVFKKPAKFSESKFAELLKMVQALTIVDGIKGRTGIESAQYKNPHLDEDILAQDISWGVLRVERNNPKFGGGTIAIELRSGTKDLRLIRFIEAVITSRMASGDWGDLGYGGYWNLMSDNLYEYNVIAERFGVTVQQARRLYEIFEKHTEIGYRYLVPLWGWDDINNPFLSPTKQEFLKSLTKSWIEQVAALPINSKTEENARELMVGWVKASGLSEDIRKYIGPYHQVSETARLHHFRPRLGRRQRANPVNVNDIDLGIEYSGKFPLRYSLQVSDYVTSDEQVAWVRTVIDLNDEEREKLIAKIAADLSDYLGGSEVTRLAAESGHGHGLDVAFEIRDSKGRRWRVEWDGINRSYDSRGRMIPQSARGGSIELVTPKFTPTMHEMHSVFAAFDDNGIIPSLKYGGGHINFDLAAFKGKPKEFARFLHLFHKHRGLISLMFQHPHRLKNAEPVELTPKLQTVLANFSGSEDDLKKLLYNEGYFNRRVGRKTRYTQLELSAFFQDIIPGEYITQDFDISNPSVHWRRQFKVDPSIRKGEFKLFNAPRNAGESALQQKLVRALMHKALNETVSIAGPVQELSHWDYLEDPDLAYQHLKNLCHELGLKEADYYHFVGEGLSETDLYTRSEFFMPFQARMKNHPVVTDWKKAISKPRKVGFRSKDRKWQGEPLSKSKTYRQKRVRTAREAMELREAELSKKVPISVLRRKHNCDELIRQWFRAAI